MIAKKNLPLYVPIIQGRFIKNNKMCVIVMMNDGTKDM